jgi:drug/metabolite transporter (DMT)-like permease
MTKEKIDFPGFLAILVLTLLWGGNYFAIKVSNTGLSPIFTAFLRSVIASFCGIVYCIAIRQPLFHRDIRLLHGAVVGVLFGVEFVCMYLGLIYTNAGRAAVLVYCAPFVVAAGAHFFLGERLSVVKTASLILAFLGVYFVFAGKPVVHTKLMVLGDALELTTAVLWGITTLYIKRFLADRVHPINTFTYQLLFSIPIILAMALLLEPKWVTGNGVDTHVIVSLAYQSIIVAFASYLTWFKLIQDYPVVTLSVFTFLTPIFGVISGIILLKEDVTTGLLVGLTCVCAGIYGTNRQQRPVRRSSAA